MPVALFANLTRNDFGYNYAPKAYVQQEQAFLYALADLIWEEVHKEPRSEAQIAVWLGEMEDILKRKRRRR